MPQPKTSSSRRATTKQAPAAKRSTSAAAAGAEQTAEANLAALRDLLRRGVVLSHDAVKAAMDDAVRREHLTRRQATELTRSLLAAGRTQADGFRADLEQVVGKGRTRAAQSSDRVRREVDRARTRAGVGAAFPISRYDDLNARQVTSRLADLSKPQLRKVRDHERRHANRKSVLEAIEKKLA